MARPITWQDVAAPRGSAVAIEAMLRAGRQAGQGLENIGQTFMDANLAQKEAATGAAVAAIANSDNPMAQQAATPTGWQFDPLAVAAAANAREGQLFDRKVGESNLRENEAQITNLQSEMADRESKRHIATLIAPYEALARAGKDFDVDEDSDPMWKTPAGFEAKKHLEGLKNTAFSQQQERERTGLARTQAKAAQDAYNLTLKQQEAADRMAAWRFSPAGSAATPDRVLEQAMLIAKETDTGEAFAVQLKDKYGSDAYRGAASREQLATLAPQGMSYQTPIDALLTKNAQQEREFNKREQQRTAINAAVTALGENSYAGMAPGRINTALIEKNKEKVGFFQTEKDIQQQRDLQVDLAQKDAASVAKEMNMELPKGFRALTPEQEAQLVELTLQNVAVSDRYSSDNAAAKSLRRDYIRYNLLGGDKNFEKQAAEDAAAVQKTIQRNNEWIAETEAAARLRDSIPSNAFDFAVKQYRTR